MPTRFQSRFQTQALPVLEREHSTQIQLKNGSDLSIAFGVLSRTYPYESVGVEIGIPIKVIRRDYYLSVTDCIIDGQSVVPKRGMYIVEDGVSREIVEPNAEIPAVELEPGGFRYLVHTQEVTGF